MTEYKKGKNLKFFYICHTCSLFSQTYRIRSLVPILIVEVRINLVHLFLYFQSFIFKVYKYTCSKAKSL